MLSREENELVTRVGPGTPLGEVMRRYWVPAALSSELPEPDSPPIRVKLLGENLVAFRDSQGRLGLLGEFCAHRCALLFLGRNEESGLRCVYHGWKYDVEGNCVDMPNEPPESSFKDKIHLKAYPTVELGGVIWGYLGPKEKVPALPKFEWTQAPESHRHVTKTWQESNWLQALEGGIDSDHASFLHRAIAANTKRAGSRGYHNKWKGTKLEVRRTDFGLLYGNTRYLGEEGNYVVTTHYVLPFHTFFATGTDPLSSFVDSPPIHGHIFVPRDDENTMIYNLTYYYSEAPPGDKRWRETIDHYRGRDPGEQTADFRKVRNKENDWLIDRRVQKTETFTGIDGINTQDHAVQESMGPIVDRTREHLSRTDKAVIMARQLLIEAAKAVQTGGDPPGLKPTYYRVRALARLLPGDADWWETLKDQIFPQPSPSA